MAPAAKLAARVLPFRTGCLGEAALIRMAGALAGISSRRKGGGSNSTAIGAGISAGEMDGLT
jgi:hypothetical protein